MLLTQSELGTELSYWKARFDTKWKVSANGTCWLWQAGIRSDHYGQFHVNRKPIAAHRAAYLFYKGDLEQGKLVCHSCDSPLCVNPEHLYLASPAQNSADMVQRGRSLVGELHHQAKLSEAQVLEIRASSGTSGRIAKRYGVDSSLIRMIRRRAIWRHI